MVSGLLARWEGPRPVIQILDEESLALVRLKIQEVGRSLGLGESTVATAALIATELGKNQLSHARSGEIAVFPLERLRRRGIQIQAADRGPGIVDPGEAMLPRPSSRSLHAGLAAVANLSDELEIDDRIGEGFLVSAIKYDEAPETKVQCGIYGRPTQGEPESGDDASFTFTEPGFLLAVGDGFGHGLLARESSGLAMDFVAAHAESDIRWIAERVHDELREKRGLMLGLCRFDARTRTLGILGAGDISGVLHRAEANEAIFFRSGPVGSHFGRERFRIRSLQVGPGDLLILHTDGVRETLDLISDRMLTRRPALEIAHQLVEKFGRVNDDALAAVVRFY